MPAGENVREDRTGLSSRGDTRLIVDRAWSFAHVLRDEGLSYLAYIEQITFLLFLKMADEISAGKPGEQPLVPAEWGWQSLVGRSGPNLIDHYNTILDGLSRKPGMLGAIFRKPRPEIENPRTLQRLIVDLIEPESWSTLDADVKGDVYEGLLARTAAESPKGAGQYFTPRGLIAAIVDCVRPTTTDTVCDPAAGTGGFLLAALDNIRRGPPLDAGERRHLAEDFVHGWELVPNTARLCVMNLYLHGVTSDPSPIHAGMDALAQPAGRQFSLILTNPPFGKKGGEVASSAVAPGAEPRPDFRVRTANKQLNFIQHAISSLERGGRCAMVLPDNVLFEAGAAERIRRILLTEFRVHTLLRLPPGIFYAQTVKANVLFFDRSAPPEDGRLWVYDLRTDKHFTLRTRPIQRSDFNHFVECYGDGSESSRSAAVVADLERRWRPYSYGELLLRKAANLEISWHQDETSNFVRSDLKSASELARLISDELRDALAQFDGVAERLSSIEDG